MRGDQIATADADYRKVGIGIVADQIGLRAAAVAEGDIDAPRAAHDVAVGENVAVWREDEARAGRMRSGERTFRRSTGAAARTI